MILRLVLHLHMRQDGSYMTGEVGTVAADVLPNLHTPAATEQVLRTPCPNAIAVRAQGQTSVQGRDQKVTWPSMPKHCTPSVTQQEPRTQSTEPPARRTLDQDQVLVDDEQDIAILRTFTNTMRALVSSPSAPAARKALHVLDVLSPVL